MKLTKQTEKLVKYMEHQIDLDLRVAISESRGKTEEDEIQIKLNASSIIALSEVLSTLIPEYTYPASDVIYSVFNEIYR